MTGLLDRMERNGLLYREADPSDRRAQLIYLSAIGHEVKPTVLHILEEVLHRVFRGITPKEIQQTKDVLRRVLANAAQEGNRA